MKFHTQTIDQILCIESRGLLWNVLSPSSTLCHIFSSSQPMDVADTDLQVDVTETKQEIKEYHARLRMDVTAEPIE